VGATQSARALLTDATLRRGDLVMTRTGARHFDGSARLPYKPAHFSDAVASLTNRREIAVIRAMEVASLRDGGGSQAVAFVRNRVVVDVRQAEENAARAVSIKASSMPRGFVELQAREHSRPTTLQVVRRAPGLVALN
jgi:hypothetical protein